MRQIIFIILFATVITVNSNVIDSVFQGRSIASIRGVLKCASSLDYACMLDYIENGVDLAYKNLMREADAESRRSLEELGRKKGDEDSPSSIISTITSMLSELPELLRATLSAAISNEGDEKTPEGGEEDEAESDTDDDDEEEEEETEDDEEEADDEDNENVKDDKETKIEASKNCKGNGTCTKVKSKSNTAVRSKHSEVSRKKKKGKIQKLKAFIKLAIAAIVIVVKLTILLKLLAAKLQIKFFLIALVNLGINVARFWWDLKKGHQPQKVIYYEHAQHQHHYDGAEDYHSSGPGESYWSRSYDKVDDKNAQDLAYSKQAPSGTTYTRVNDKPNFSWNPWAERSL